MRILDSVGSFRQYTYQDPVFIWIPMPAIKIRMNETVSDASDIEGFGRQRGRGLIRRRPRTRCKGMWMLFTPPARGDDTRIMTRLPGNSSSKRTQMTTGSEGKLTRLLTRPISAKGVECIHDFGHL